MKRVLVPSDGRHLAWPFVAIAAVAVVSVLLPPGPAHPAFLLMAVGVVPILVAIRWLPNRTWRPELTSTLPLLLATAAIGMLIFSAGTKTGLSALVLLPVSFSALYGRPRDSAVVIPAAAITLALLGANAHDSVTVLVRLVVFWLSLMSMISFTTHLLRSRLAASVAEAEEETRQASVVAQATRTLTSILDPELVVRAAVRLATEMGSPPNAAGRRAQYFSIAGARANLVADDDDTGASVVGEVIALDDHPIMAAVVKSGSATNQEIDIAACGPRLQLLLTMLHVTHAAYVPVHLGGALHGVLVASGRGKVIPSALFERLMLLGNLTELALANASAHRRLEEDASTDLLTGLANRREFELAIARLPIRRPYAFFAADIDGLKVVNDTFGHTAGDDLIIAVANALASVVRRGDTMARLGGDEFAVLVLDATADTAANLALRIQSAVTEAELATGRARISLGVCTSTGGEPELIRQVADDALYAAKTSGGARTVVRDLRSEVLVDVGSGEFHLTHRLKPRILTS